MNLKQPGIRLTAPFLAEGFLEFDGDDDKTPTQKSSDDDQDSSVDNPNDSNGGYGRSSGFVNDD